MRSWWWMRFWLLLLIMTPRLRLKEKKYTTRCAADKSSAAAAPTGSPNGMAPTPLAAIPSVTAAAVTAKVNEIRMILLPGPACGHAEFNSTSGAHQVRITAIGGFRLSPLG